MLIATSSIGGEYTVQLSTNEDRTHFYVTYGLQAPIVVQSFMKAWVEFTNCVFHASACAGIEQG